MKFAMQHCYDWLMHQDSRENKTNCVPWDHTLQKQLINDAATVGPCRASAVLKKVLYEQTVVAEATRSYFLGGNSVSFPERYSKSEKGVTTGFSVLNSKWGKRMCKRPIWLDNCAWLGISSERLACRWKGTCHRFQSTVGSATTEIRTLRELGLHTLIY